MGYQRAVVGVGGAVITCWREGWGEGGSGVEFGVWLEGMPFLMLL